jgi:hypothetical protein
MENHRFFMGKSPFFHGKITVFMGKFTSGYCPRTEKEAKYLSRWLCHVCP